MILGTIEIRERMSEIFADDSGSVESIKEASYALRVAGDGMIIGKEIIEPCDEKRSRAEIEIEPGRIAVLSTKERLKMPGDLVGRLGVRIKFASRGLAGLMGIQVDPYYGSKSKNGERLYIKVANLGNKTVRIEEGDLVFNMEFSKVKGADDMSEDKPDTWNRLNQAMAGYGDQLDWTSLTRIQSNLDAEMENKIAGIRDGQQSVVMFGVFLVAITILATMVTQILNVENAPSWVTDWGWGFLIFFCGVSTAAIVYFLLVPVASEATASLLRKIKERNLREERGGHKCSSSQETSQRQSTLDD